MLHWGCRSPGILWSQLKEPKGTFLLIELLAMSRRVKNAPQTKARGSRQNTWKQHKNKSSVSEECFFFFFPVNCLLRVKYCHGSVSAISRCEVWSLCSENRSFKSVKRASKIKTGSSKCKGRLALGFPSQHHASIGNTYGNFKKKEKKKEGSLNLATAVGQCDTAHCRAL